MSNNAAPTNDTQKLIQWILVMTTLFATKDFSVKSNLLLYRNWTWTRLKHEYWIFFNIFFINHTFCIFVRIASPRRFLQISKTYVFLKNDMGQSVKKYTSSWFLCRPNWRYNEFSVITNVVIKRVHCTSLSCFYWSQQRYVLSCEYARFFIMHFMALS